MPKAKKTTLKIAIGIFMALAITLSGCSWFEPPTKEQCDAAYSNMVKIMINTSIKNVEQLDNLNEGLVKHLLTSGFTNLGKYALKFTIKDPFMAACLSSTKLECKCVMRATDLESLDKCEIMDRIDMEPYEKYLLRKKSSVTGASPVPPSNADGLPQPKTK